MAALLMPSAALAKTVFPAFFGVYVISLFIVIPAIAAVLLFLVFLAWCRDQVTAYWMLAGLAAAAIGALALWAILAVPKPILTELTWPAIYLALAPLIAVWLMSRRKRVVDSGAS